MKKILCILLCTLLCISALCACSSNKADTSDDPSDATIETPSVDISYDEVSYIIPGGNDSSVAGNDSSASSEEQPSESSTTEPSEIPSESSDEEPNSGEQQTGGFAVKMAKYDYDNTLEQQNSYAFTHIGKAGTVSIALLDITNETDKHYSITINGRYLDKDGRVLKAETQTWDQFKSGWQKYFLFRPGITFEKFEYTIEMTEYTGDCWKCGVKFSFKRLEKETKAVHPAYPTDNPKYVEGIGVVYTKEIDTPFPVSHGLLYMILFDASNHVIGIYQRGGTGGFGVEPEGPDDNLGIIAYYSERDDGKLGEWPEQFKGNVTGIGIISSVDKPTR